MASLVGVLDCSHVWIGRPPELWDAVRQSRDIRADVPTETMEERIVKAERVAAAVRTLKDKLTAMNPDVLLIFGDDQGENYPAPEFRIVPQILIHCGEEFSGVRYDARGDEPKQAVKNDPKLALALVRGLLEHGFDPSFCLNMPNPDQGIGHAVMNPIGYFTDYSVPVVPIVLNAIFSPSLTGARANQLGRAVRKIIDAYPEDLRVVAVGSGGLWHTTNAPQTWLNEEFDRLAMKFLEVGDLKGWANHFDGWVADIDDQSQWPSGPHRNGTGLPTMPGPQFGTREELDWIAASSMAEGSPFVIADMIQIYSSPIDCTFAYCEDVRPLDHA